jgi:PAS domain S-box-containing protein
MEIESEKGLSKRILTLFIFTTTVLILQGIYNIYSLDGVNDSITKVYNSVNLVSVTSSEISLPISELRQLSMSLVMAPNKTLRDQLDIQIIALQNKIQTRLNNGNGKKFADPEAKELLGVIRAAWQGYSMAVDDTRGYVNEGVRIAEFISVTIHEKIAYNKVTNAIVAYNAYQLKISEKTFKSAQDNAVIAFWAVLITTVIEIVILKFILTYMLNLVRRYVAARKHHAEELKNKNEALEQSVELKKLLDERILGDENLHKVRSYLANIINSMPSVLIGVDMKCKVTQWNNWAEQATGVSVKEALGQPLVHSFSRLSSEMPWIQNAIKSRQKQSILERQYQQDGLTLYEEMTIYPLIANRVEGAVIRLDDITEKFTNEIALRRAQKMEAVGQLTGGIAHDFNNILGIVIGNLELLQATVIGNDKALDRIKKALKGALRGADITRRLLSFSRDKTQECQRINVNNVIGDMDDLITKSLTVSIEVLTYLADDLWLINIDPGDVEDAILNLSLNAKDAMPEGGSLFIETSNKVFDDRYVRANPGSSRGDFVMISVSDNGTGMTEEVKELVLEPFFSTKEPGKGTGLGLSMVYGFVKRSGGHIKIYTELGEGTTFNLFLPRAREEVQLDNQKEKSTTVLPRGTQTILIVDDEEALVDVATEYLNDLGYSVLTALDAKQALRVIEDNNNIDLVFSDVIMPGGMDGYQLADVVHKTHPKIKTLLVSGFTKNREELMGTDNEYLHKLTVNRLQKPYSRSELAIAIHNNLNESI